MVPFIYSKFWPTIVLSVFVGVWLIMEVWIILREHGQISHRHDDKTLGLIVTLAVAGIVLANIMAWIFPEARIPRNGWVLLFFGITCMLIGMGLRAWAVHTLGRFFRRVVMVQSHQRVIAHGPYHFLRHPSYTGSLLTIFGYSLALGNWLSIFAAVGLAFIGFYRRIQVEEAYLEKHFGEAYTRYMRCTWRLFPGIW